MKERVSLFFLLTATQVCQGCDGITIVPATSAERKCQPVFWSPPQTVPARTGDTMISDCDHFPGSTFPFVAGNTASSTTTVVYTVNVAGLTQDRYCKFEVVITSATDCKYSYIL